MAAFSYRHNPFTPEQYEAMLEKLALMFVKWRVQRDFYRNKPVDVAFKLWWMSKGPTGFGSSDDRLRFKQDLLNKVYTLKGINVAGEQ